MDNTKGNRDFVALRVPDLMEVWFLGFAGHAVQPGEVILVFPTRLK